MASFYHHDSFMPTLNLRPEELDRLDASQIEPSESPTLRLEQQKYRNLEASIDGTLNKYSTNRQTQAPFDVQRYGDVPTTMDPGGYGNHFMAPPALAPNPFLPASSAGISPQIISSNNANMILTPPPSHPGTLEKPSGGSQKSMIELLKMEKEQAIAEMQRLSDKRVEMVQFNEAERFKQQDREHRQQMLKVQAELEEMLRQHEQVIRLKNEVEHGLQLELGAARKDLHRERDMRLLDREKYTRTVRDLTERLREAEQRIAELEGIKRRNRVSFSTSNSSSSMSFDEYQERLKEIQKENDIKIANLARHFEREKSANHEIMKTRIKAEVNLLLPRIKEQYRLACVDKLRTLKEQLTAQFRAHYQEQLRKMQEEHAMERKLWQRQLRDQLEQERQSIMAKLKAKYEMRMLDMQNECERRILQRLRHERHEDTLPDEFDW